MLLFEYVVFLCKQNSTPKKNSSANGSKGSTSRQVLPDSDQVDTHTPVPDLRLEAKISAEVGVIVLALLEFGLYTVFFNF